MKRLFLITLGILLLASSTNLLAGDKAGEVIDDSVYHDFTYDFTIKVADGWEVARIKDADDIYRVTISKVSPVMPVKYNENPHLFTYPKLTVMADTTTVSLDSLETLLSAREGKVDIVKQAIKDFGLLTYSKYRPEFEPSVTIKYKDFEGLILPARKQMDISDYRRGTIYFLQNDEITLIIEAVAELERFSFNDRAFGDMVRSIRVGREEPKEEEAVEIIQEEEVEGEEDKKNEEKE
ncbi:MAG TPA: hypothetical protein ENO22_10335 [candidate division Zixibacteria bacterium]|nr:hypothetical protein [candidate division Zixibacteria bacterium]HEQ99724.1 hypothetical protein [candidate division Zixibacteria bacterium]